jgi:anaerobic selenocysteine-containing dehydrogenase
MARVILDEGLCDEAFLNEHVEGWAAFAAYLREQVSLPWAAAETRLPVRTIRETAIAYATGQPAMIWIGFGMQRHANAVQAVRAIDALAVMTGQIGRPGTGVQFASQETWVFGNHLKSYRKNRRRPYQGPGAVDVNRTFPMGRTAQAMAGLADPPLRLLWVAGANPVAQEPDADGFREQLRQLDLVVVVDQFMTATAAEADLVLPATTFLEQSDLQVSYWHHCVSITERAVAPLYEARSDLAIAWALSHKLNQLSPGFTDFPASGDEWEWVEREWNERARQLFAVPDAAALRNGAVRANLPVTAWEARRFCTPSGKVELRSAVAAATGYPELPAYVPPVPAPAGHPIRLLTPHPAESLHSQFHDPTWLPRVSARPVLEMHPALADDLGVAEGDLVRVSNAQGELRLPVRLTRTVPLDTVVAYEGTYSNLSYNVNLLTAASPPEWVFPGVAYGDCFVAVEPVREEGADD